MFQKFSKKRGEGQGGSKPPARDPVLLKLLDGFYREIQPIESRYGLQTSPEDLRCPVEYYHDAVRAWLAEDRDPERNTVESLADAIEGLRADTYAARMGGQVFLPGMPAKEAGEFKKKLLLNAASLSLPREEVMQDLAAFLELAKGYDKPQQMEDELESRRAWKYQPAKGGKERWAILSPDELWQKLRQVRGLVVRAGESLTGGRTSVALAEAAQPTRMDDPESLLKELWVQIVHPANLARAFVRQGGGIRFERKGFTSERQWQQMGKDARLLAELYEKYTLIFAAAMKDVVDKHYKENKDELDAAVQELTVIESLLDGKKLEEISQQEIMQLTESIEDKKLREMLLAWLLAYIAAERNRRQTEKEALAASQAIEDLIRQADIQLDKLEKDHVRFLASQLAVYENAKELVKKFALQGLNIAGQFVQSETSRGPERGGRGWRGRT